MKFNLHSLFLSALIKIFLLTFLLVIPKVQADISLNVLVGKSSKERVTPFLLSTSASSDIKQCKRSITPDLGFLPHDFSFFITQISLPHTDVSFSFNYKKCFTKKAKARSPPCSYLS